MPTTNSKSPTSALHKPKSDFTVTLGFIAVVLFFIGSGIISYLNVRVLQQDSAQVVRTHQIITALNDVLSIMKDAETGQRGFLITGKDSYLEPYKNAETDLDERISTLEQLLETGSSSQARLPDMKTHIHAKMSELAGTIELRRTKGFDAAKEIVLTDRGKDQMDALRDEVGLTQSEEEQIRDHRIAEMANAYQTAIFSGLLTCILGVALSVVVASMVRRGNLKRLNEEWLQTGQVGLSNAMFGDQQIEQLGENILTFLSGYLNAQAAVLFTNDGGEFGLAAHFGIADLSAVPRKINLNEGLTGQAVKDKKTFFVHDLPDGYLKIGSALGKSIPRYLIVSPTEVDGIVNSVYELAFLQPLDQRSVELLERLSDPIGVAVRTALDRSRLQNLLEETQRQGEELQTQSEELRVSNEELEEQSRALKESQYRLEQQQAELEQNNAQLEEQTQILEHQRDELARAKGDLEAQAQDLERTSRFKSDFLANMSHELRTPLNSSLILAKLLGDNREGNLTEEQVKYAKTIQSAGNDLLTLISDILDLSKIEAGHMEVQVQKVRVEDLISSLTRTFEPISNEKSLTFTTEVAPGTPDFIETDSQRLEQILKNLLSNAMKFTSKGGVTLQVSAQENRKVCFSVIDTGIGIAPAQQEMVFEAFRQADGTTNRKYGGTGLGLSISRQLAQLLGGEVTLTSESGVGSTFSVIIPAVFGAPGMAAPTSQMVRTPSPSPSPQPLPQPAASEGYVDDDRQTLTRSDRLILIVEDDQSFSRILYELAHEHGFKCLIARTAEGAISLAAQFLPSAVLLDVGLPDHSGLSVLDRLKQDGRTRHIPVHVVSGSDYSRTAMALGAIGFMMKPVKREELIHAFENLESKLTQRMRRVLVVEDDTVQLDSLRLLLGSRDVETVGVGSAAECLQILGNTTFDCMVLDLSLPDASGFTLLETLSQEEAYSFPPVIVYTGRELNLDEEQRLRKYSKSIIVKGAKSPERLLDEVTLFLHQVVADLPDEKQKLIERAKSRDAALENRLILIVEDDIRNIFALTSILEPRGANVEIARNGREALEHLDQASGAKQIDLVLMDIMMPEMDGFTAMREIRRNPEWKKLPIIALTAKAMKNDQEQCLAAGANDYIAKPLDVEKLLSLIRVWMPRE